MKKTKLFIITLAAVMSLSACGSDVDNSSVEMSEQTTTEAKIDSKKENAEEQVTVIEETQAENGVIEPAAEDFEYMNEPAYNGIRITEYKGEHNAIRIPEEIDGKTVVAVELKNPNITYVEIPEGIDGRLTKFWYCESLEKVIIPESFTNIDFYAFAGCTNLEEINIPDGVTIISDFAFKDCTNLTEVNLPNSLICIKGEAFANCKSLTSLTMPDSVSRIAQDSFSGCETLTVTYKGAKYTDWNDLFKAVFGTT